MLYTHKIENKLQEGTVIKSTGSWYLVRMADGSHVRSRIMGKFRLNGLSLTNPVAVGDKVALLIDDQEGQDKTGLIKEIKSRQNYIIRQSPKKRRSLHLLASNVDQAFVVVTIVQPNLKQGFIDRFLMMTEPHDVPTWIVFNKSDLYSEDDLFIFEMLKDIYEKIGYHVLLVSSVDGTGIEEMKAVLKGKTNFLGGQSGVGKSTLINQLAPGLELRTSDISEYSGKGQHTTTFAEMFALDKDSFIIDTPGIKTLAFSNLEPMDVAHNFREFFKLSPSCKFANCTHRNEPKCAVKAALEAEEISDLRYVNYITIMEEIEEQNSWERHKDF